MNKIPLFIHIDEVSEQSGIRHEDIIDLMNQGLFPKYAVSAGDAYQSYFFPSEITQWYKGAWATHQMVAC